MTNGRAEGTRSKQVLMMPNIIELKPEFRFYISNILHDIRKRPIAAMVTSMNQPLTFHSITNVPLLDIGSSTMEILPLGDQWVRPSQLTIAERYHISSHEEFELQCKLKRRESSLLEDPRI